MAQDEIWENAKIVYYRLLRQRIRPSDWFCLPSPGHFPPKYFHQFPPRAPISKMSIEKLIRRVLGRLKLWVISRQCYSGILLPTVCQNLVMEPDAGNALRGYSDNGAVGRKLTLNMGALDLAISVFQNDHDDGQILISRDVCPRNKTTSGRPSFCRWGSESAEEIIRLVEEERGITAEKMDEKDNRFLCLNCHRANGGSWEGAKVHTWRTAVCYFTTDTQLLCSQLTMCLPLIRFNTMYQCIHLRCRTGHLSLAGAYLIQRKRMLSRPGKGRLRLPSSLTHLGGTANTVTTHRHHLFYRVRRR